MTAPVQGDAVTPLVTGRLPDRALPPDHPGTRVQPLFDGAHGGAGRGSLTVVAVPPGARTGTGPDPAGETALFVLDGSVHLDPGPPTESTTWNSPSNYSCRSRPRKASCRNTH